MASGNNPVGTLALVTLIGGSVYIGGSVLAMYYRRHLSPVKEHSIGMVTIAGVGGFTAESLLFLAHLFVGDTYPCYVMFWGLMALIPVYCFPFFLMSVDLFDKYELGEVLLELGKLKKAENGNVATADINKVAAKLRWIRLRSSPRGKVIKMLMITIPVILFSVVLYVLEAEQGQWNPGNNTCMLSLEVLCAYAALACIYIGSAIMMVRKLKTVDDAYGIKREITLVNWIQFAVAFAYILLVSVQPTTTAYNRPVVIMIFLTHYIVCVKPTLETFGIKTILVCRRNVPVRVESDIGLDTVLADEVGIGSFESHLIREFSVENIEFWKEVKLYKSLQPTDPEVKARSQYLIDNFVAANSPNWVNLSGAVRSELEQDVSTGNIDLHTFDKAQHEIFLLMSRDSFQRYKQSPLFQKYLNVKQVKPSHSKLRSSSLAGNTDENIGRKRMSEADNVQLV